ncbi:regulator of G-protein signaling 9-binding protein-like [Ambystoma mexicanum]|uniref:regulator of G-protein signaling 9-binding protein-like n=1 Tax=Ambystoma mexicanum TaxID=8296 RepID=UPI0037E87D6F
MLASRGQSVDEPKNSKEVVEDCMKAYTSLNKVTAYYRHLVLCLGGTSDSTRLREDLEDCRKRAHELSTGLQNKLMSLLTEQEVSPDERVQLERMFVLFLSTLEMFQQDLYKAQHLYQLFPQQTRRRCHIKTGTTGKPSDLSWRHRSLKSPSSRLGDVVEPQVSSDLAVQIEHLERMVHEMEMKVSVPIWTVEATEEAWAEGTSTREIEDGSTNEILVTEETLSRGCCAQSQPWHRLPCLIS